MSKTTYYKFMKSGCVSPFQDTKLEPDVWLPQAKGTLKICRNGYHFCDATHLAEWANTELYRVEIRGKILKTDDKYCASQVKLTRIHEWNHRTEYLWRADIAERVLLFWEQKYPEDQRPRQAIEGCRKYAVGEITQQELKALSASAYSSAYSAAYSAEEHAAAYAAYAAAAAAAYDVAYAAAYVVATERAWQSTRLLWYLEDEK